MLNIPKVITTVFIIVLLLPACKRQSSNISGGKTDSLHFIFISTCANESFFDPVKKGMNDAAGMLNVSCEFTGTVEVDKSLQVKMVEDAINKKYDGIALNIIDTAVFDEVIKKAIDKGIPVVAFNVDDAHSSNARLGSVCQNLYQAGVTMGKEVSDNIPLNAKILLCLHSEGISALEERKQGILDALKEKNISCETIITGTEPEKACKIIKDKITSEAGIKAILCTGQADTEGAGLALEQTNNKSIFAAGFDLSAEILRLIDEGKLSFTIDQQPYIQGFYPVVQLTLYCRYGIKPSDIDAGATIIRKNDVNKVINLSKNKNR